MSIYKKFAFTKLAFAFCAIFLAICAYISVFTKIETRKDYGTALQCKNAISDDLGAKIEKLELASGDESGFLRIAGYYPTKVAMGDILCIAVAGVAPKSLQDELRTKQAKATKEYQEAKLEFEKNERKDAARDALEVKEKAYYAALDGSLAPDVSLSLFLDGQPLPGAKFVARPIPETQHLHVKLAIDANSNSESGLFWRNLLSGAFFAEPLGEKTVSLGIARLPTDAAIEAEQPITFVAFLTSALVTGGIALALFFFGCISLARCTNLLREVVSVVPSQAGEKVEAARTKLKDVTLELATNAIVVANEPLKQEIEAKSKDLDTLLQEAGATMTEPATAIAPFSLAKVQIGIWAFLVIAGFVYIWLALGQHKNLLTVGILGLLGIQVLSTTTSVQINTVYGADTFKSSKGREGFWQDILRDVNGLNLGRLQALLWTFLLAGIFIWDTVWNFTFPDFDTNLLLLLGITQGAYLGMKYAAIPKAS